MHCLFSRKLQDSGRRGRPNAGASLPSEDLMPCNSTGLRPDLYYTLLQSG